MRTDQKQHLRPWLGLCVALLALAGCAADRQAPWNQPEYGSTYCENCAEVKGALGAAEYGPANWVESPNYKVANRGPGAITVVVMHTVQGSYNGCISWFQNPAAQVSAHYVVSKTGAVTQMVHEKDIAWHVGSENGYTVGIEHEGFVDDPAWVTAPMIETSTQLTCYLLKKYGLAASNSSIKGHVQLPNQTHVDPGKYWPYADYLAKVQACMGGAVATCPGGCDDGKACTDDSCVGGACSHTPNTGAVCWDGDACTAGEKCQNGACVGGKIVKDCNDNNGCTDDGCTAGNCTHNNNAAPCDDGNACTAGDHCAGGSCVGGGAASCDDGNPCTVGDKCVGGGCQPGTLQNCDDGNPCTVGDACAPGGCLPGVPKNCDDGKPCTVDSCAAGACQHLTSTGPCNDGDGCTVGDQCVGGLCKGAAKSCEDGNPCTKDACAGGGCVNIPLDGGCDDGDVCTVGDYCASGLCLSGGAMDCDDGFDCTTDTCLDGKCQHLGQVQEAKKVCQGDDVAVLSPCGDPPVIETCPAGRKCKDGKCQFPDGKQGGTDASTDRPPDAVVGADGTGDAGPIGYGNGGQAASGCSAGTAAVAGWWLAFCALAGLWWARRRASC